MTDEPRVFPLLHVHAQGSWHQEAYIVGNRLGLRTLRDLVDRALGHSSAAVTPDDLVTRREAEVEVFTADGEGYSVVVQLDDAPWESDSWERAAVPYTKTHAKERRREALWPWDRSRPASAEGEHDAAADRLG